jgi:hypothetical protein
MRLGVSASMPISSATRFLCRLSSTVSLATIAGRRVGLNAGDRVQWYVVVWLLVLALGAWQTPVTGIAAIIVLTVAFYRLQDLLFAVIDDALRLTCRSIAFRFPQAGTDNRAIRGRKAATTILVVNVVQIILIFAIGYHIVNTDASGMSKGVITLPTGAPQLGWFDYLYLSWTNLFTLGSGDLVTGIPAEVLVALELASGFILIGTGLATFISRDIGAEVLSGAEPKPIICDLPCAAWFLGKGCATTCRVTRISR